METNNENQSRLYELTGSDYEIVDGQSDIRGWEVMDESGNKTGDVEELLFEKESRKVRYMVLSLSDNDYDMDERLILVPIGVARLHAEDDTVIVPAISAENLTTMPRYQKDNLTMEMEYKAKSLFSKTKMPAFDTSVNDFGEMDTFYDDEHFNETNLYKNRNSGNDIPSQPEWLRKTDS